MNKEDTHMSEESHLDPLTGFLRRIAFEDFFELAMEEAIKENKTFTLAFLDIDNFLRINEEYGHIGGDLVLETLGNIIKETTGAEAVPGRFGTVAGRYGGDEFAIFFPDVEREQTFLTMERIREEVEGTGIYQDDQTVVEDQITISCGIASYPIDGSTTNEIIRKADQALYKAKKSGRNNIMLAYEERMVPKTAHFTMTQLERLSQLAEEQGIGEAVLLREALDDLLSKYVVTKIEN